MVFVVFYYVMKVTVILLGVVVVVKGTRIVKSGEVNLPGGEEIGEPDLEPELLKGEQARALGYVFILIGCAIAVCAGVFF
ncbi:MAG: hypothetical protein HKN23_01970 [Verrucomicrobiales bacterium]|nr:hypothetical protein [Verrucomicrobiales bacterium]